MARKARQKFGGATCTSDHETRFQSVHDYCMKVKVNKETICSFYRSSLWSQKLWTNPRLQRAIYTNTGKLILNLVERNGLWLFLLPSYIIWSRMAQPCIMWKMHCCLQMHPPYPPPLPPKSATEDKYSLNETVTVASPVCVVALYTIGSTNLFLYNGVARAHSAQLLCL